MPDTVFIKGLTVDTLIGVFDWEREIRQDVILDVEMSFDNQRSAASDELIDTLDYNAISIRLIDFIQSASFQLIETLAEQCAQILRDEFNIAWLRLKLQKPGAIKAAVTVGVCIERGER